MSRNTLARVVDSLDEVLLVLDLDNKVIIQNRRLEKLLLDLDLILPADINKLIPKSLIDSNVLAETHEITYSQDEFSTLSKNVVFKWQRHLFKDDTGEHLGFTISGNDITLEKAIEAELLLKNKAIDETANSIIISEATGSGFPIIYVNRAFEALTGYSKDSILGKECKFLQGEKTEKEKLAQIREALTHGKPLSITLTNYRKDGSEFQNQLTLSPIFDSKGELTHVLGIQEDVSERERRNQLIREAQQKAEESARLKSDFLASMSHEIRTPMNGVLGMLNILKDTDLKPNQEQQLVLAQQSAQSLLVIINDILDFSKIEAGKLLLEPIEFDRYNEVNNLVKSQATAAHNKGIDIVVDMSEVSSPYLIGDPTRIKQVITNLLSNAIKFTQQGTIKLIMSSESSSFMLSPEKMATRLTVRVIDQGIGIPANQVDKIFDTFTQADSSTTRKFGGTGLGLSISRQLCQLMHGDISVTSQEGIGSEFSFTLELEASAKDFIAPKEYENKPVLILDSNPTNAKTIETQLKKWNANALLCGSMKELLEYLNTEDTYLLFVDEESLNQLPNDIFIQTRNKLETLNPSTIVISSREFQPYVNKSLFGENPAHHIKHSVKPITAKQLFDLVVQSSDDEKSSNTKQNTGSKLCSGKHILLVEDNHINQIVASNLLDTLDAVVSVANHGKEAINLLQDPNKLFDLILMDCQMPEMDGYEASQCIRDGKAGEGYQSIPIIALTANALKGDREKCLAAGMSDYISKPIEVKDLKKILKKWLGKTPKVNEVIEIEDQTTHKDVSAPNAPNLEVIDQTSFSDMIENFDTFEVWNETEMLHRIANNYTLGKQLVEVFGLDVEDIYMDLKSAFDESDMQKLGFNAHTLKGIASNISGIRLAKLCAKIENDAKENVSTYLSAYMEILHPMILELKAALDAGVSQWN